ncbi:MAG: NADP-dependent oxidoreductase [Actinomycetaceae bacterium]|nr:NADP-dependent oxidoreductase [Actinomycetaceae bacterium]
MRKLMQQADNGIEGVQLVQVPEPHAKAGEVRVAWLAGGVNPIDWKIASGSGPYSATARGLTYPIGFGSDFAGVIDEVGDGVHDFHLGDHVFGTRFTQGFGDYLVGTPEDLQLLPIPEGMSMELAGSLSTVAATAVAAIDDLGDIEGKTILIGGGAGGVGTIAVQYAAAKGARVIATGSRSSADYLRTLGAEPVTYGEGLTERVREILGGGSLDAASDLANTDVINAALELGVPSQRITLIAALEYPQGTIRTGAARARSDARSDIAQRIARGEIHVPIELSVPLDDFRTAIDRSMAGHTHGKIVVVP